MHLCLVFIVFVVSESQCVFVIVDFVQIMMSNIGAAQKQQVHNILKKDIEQQNQNKCINLYFKYAIFSILGVVMSAVVPNGNETHPQRS